MLYLLSFIIGVIIGIVVACLWVRKESKAAEVFEFDERTIYHENIKL